VQRGVAYEYAKAFRDWLNQKLKTGSRKVNVALVAMPRDQLGRALIDGKVDFVLAQSRSGRNWKNSWTSPTPRART